MAKALPELVFIYLSPGVGVDGGGFGVLPGGGGPIPIDPLAAAEAGAAVSLLHLAGRVRDPKLGAQIKEFGTTLLNGVTKQLAPRLAPSAGGQART